MPIRTRSTLALALATIGVISQMVLIPLAHAQVFNGGGLNEGINQANTIEGPVKGNNVRTVIVDLLKAVLNYLALFAVIMIVVAGFYLVLSGGNEETKEKAKKIILYVVIGLLVIIFARAIVLLVTTIIQ